MKNRDYFGWKDEGGSGGYQTVDCNCAGMQAYANQPPMANDAAANATKADWPTHVGGKYAST